MHSYIYYTLKWGTNLYKDSHSAEILNDLFALTSKENGFMHIELSEDIPKKITSLIGDMEITHVIMGQSLENKLSKLLKKDIITRVTSKAGNADILVLEKAKHVDNNNYKPLNQNS